MLHTIPTQHLRFVDHNIPANTLRSFGIFDSDSTIPHRETLVSFFSHNDKEELYNSFINEYSKKFSAKEWFKIISINNQKGWHTTDKKIAYGPSAVWKLVLESENTDAVLVRQLIQPEYTGSMQLHTQTDKRGILEIEAHYSWQDNHSPLSIYEVDYLSGNILSKVLYEKDYFLQRNRYGNLVKRRYRNSNDSIVLHPHHLKMLLSIYKKVRNELYFPLTIDWSIIGGKVFIDQVYNDIGSYYPQKKDLPHRINSKNNIHVSQVIHGLSSNAGSTKERVYFCDNIFNLDKLPSGCILATNLPLHVLSPYLHKFSGLLTTSSSISLLNIPTITVNNDIQLQNLHQKFITLDATHGVALIY